MENESYLDASILQQLNELYSDEVLMQVINPSNEPIWENNNRWKLVQQCVEPTIIQGLTNTFLLFYPCILFRIIVLLNSRMILLNHLFAGLAGTILLWHYFKYDAFWLTIQTIFGYVIIRVLYKHRGPIVIGLCLSRLLLSELYFGNYDSWKKIRGVEMIFAMKLISLAFDIDHGSINNNISFIEWFGYCNFVGTAIFGPFLTYSEYQECNYYRKINMNWVLAVLKSAILALICLIVSNCASPNLFNTDAEINIWLLAAQTAMSFRYSHYFVSYTSQFTILASGIGYHQQDDGAAHWKFEVVRPLKIELPRSLVEVVIFWNIPMHKMLKKYIYQPALSNGRLLAICLTYILCSMLHGFNFSLSAVLLSIGSYAYIEHVLRKKLARKFDACIMTRQCLCNCHHKYNQNSFWVIAANLAFGILAHIHLAYLGALFGFANETGVAIQ